MTPGTADALLGCPSFDLSGLRDARLVHTGQDGHDLVRSLAVAHQCLVCPPWPVCAHPTHGEKGHLILTESTLIVAGADTHACTVHIAFISMTGAMIGDWEFATTRGRIRRGGRVPDINGPR